MGSMINSREDYRFYLSADRLALGVEKARFSFLHETWRFQRLLRRLEYCINCRNSIIWKPYLLYLWFRFLRLSRNLGFSIPPNVFGPGLAIVHRGTIVVSDKAKVGENCRIHVCVTIGAKAGSGNEVPQIGNNVYIGPGAKIFGGIQIADGIAIGANSVVNKSYLEPNTGIAGVPAKKINDRGSKDFVTDSTKRIREIGDIGE